jgi:hypothetical protein
MLEQAVVTTVFCDVFLNNQPDALIIYPNLFCYKTLHVSGISAHHQKFSTVKSALVSFTQVLLTFTKTCTKLTSAECTVENS